MKPRKKRVQVAKQPILVRRVLLENRGRWMKSMEIAQLAGLDQKAFPEETVGAAIRYLRKRGLTVLSKKGYGGGFCLPE